MRVYADSNEFAIWASNDWVHRQWNDDTMQIEPERPHKAAHLDGLDGARGDDA